VSRTWPQLSGVAGGLPESEVVVLRRVGLLHDLRRLGISNAIWDKPGPLSRVDISHQPGIASHRKARSPERAAAKLTAEVRAGRLDGSAVEVVLETAGHPSPGRRSRPDALTSREVEILSLVTRGATNKQVAAG
jgi:HD-GYP domain-containing protein (c-di-GMP phosphodiesterase class II)